MNYRPVSLTGIVRDILEKKNMSMKNILGQLDYITFLNNKQFRFRGGRLCLITLLDLYQRVTRMKQRRAGWVDCIYLNFAKAIDPVSHDRL